MNKVESLSQLVNGNKYQVFNALVSLQVEVSHDTNKALTIALKKSKRLFEVVKSEEIILTLATRIIDDYESYCRLIDSNTNLGKKDKEELFDFAISLLTYHLDGIEVDVDDVLN